MQTRDLVERVRFQQIFVFKYSPRPGTKAARFNDDVPQLEKKGRNNDLLNLQKEISLRESERLVHTTTRTLIEGPSPRAEQNLIGRSETDRIVIVENETGREGEIRNVRITRATALALYWTNSRTELYESSGPWANTASQTSLFPNSLPPYVRWDEAYAAESSETNATDTSPCTCVSGLPPTFHPHISSSFRGYWTAARAGSPP
ncbi:MAG: TRAM domain-containing protein [Planctomycetota bacterium]|nr:TRAM domain-containing protein [Planctomycetota bacterium]